MKKLSILMVLLAISFFTIVNCSAQSAFNGNKTTTLMTTDYVGVAFCGTEQVIGTMTVEIKRWDNKIQRKTTFILEGQVSHALYVGFGIINNHYNEMPESGWNGTYTQTFSVTKDGVPVGYTHVTYHDTCSPNGEITSHVENIQFECF